MAETLFWIVMVGIGIVVCGVVGVAILYLVGINDWMNRGSH
jgi:hypothetical protein